MLKIYFSPMACSAASRIAIQEAGAEATFIEVDAKTKTLVADGSDYRRINPLGYVPFLEDGDLRLSENAAILQHVADAYPDAGLAPTDRRGRTQLQRWLAFVGTELHKALFAPLLDPNAPAGAKEYALSRGASRLAWLEGELAARAFLLDRFSVADAYLVTVLAWTAAAPVKLGPETQRYFQNLRKRPGVAAAVREELGLYQAERDRHR